MSAPAFKCPQCGKTDGLCIAALVFVEVIVNDQDNFETETVGDHEWNEHNRMDCPCGYIGTVKEFRCEQAMGQVS